MARRLRRNRMAPAGSPDWSGARTIEGLVRAAPSKAYSWVR